MPANYQLGKIYGIFAPSIFKVYIGSTTQSINSRMINHRKRNSTCKSKPLMKHSDMKVVLIENFPCNSRKELERREGEWIKSLEGSGMSVNKQIAGRTHKEWLQSTKGKSIHTQATKKYRDTNKDKLIEVYVCLCGGKYISGNKARHMKSKKHLDHGRKVTSYKVGTEESRVEQK